MTTNLDRRLANRDAIARVQAAKGLTVSERCVAGPAVADAREANRHGWTIVDLSPYTMTLTNVDGDHLSASYSSASNGVLSAETSIDGHTRSLHILNAFTLRDQVRQIIELNDADN